MMFAASRLFARALLLAGSVVAAAPDALATGLDSMDAFVKAARSGRASFTQVVTSPAKEGQAVRSKTSSGSFEFQRPGRFRFSYKKPFEQTIVADGETLWLYDLDLNQVTARKQAQTLGSTPAALSRREVGPVTAAVRPNTRTIAVPITGRDSEPRPMIESAAMRP